MSSPPIWPRMAGPGSWTSRPCTAGRASTPTMPTSTSGFCSSPTPPIELCRRREWAPAIAHGNDWQTGMLPLYLKSIYADDPLFVVDQERLHDSQPRLPGSLRIHHPSRSLPRSNSSTCFIRTTCGRAGSTSWSMPFSTPTPSRPSPPPTPGRSRHPSTVPASMACFVSAPSNLVGILNGIDRQHLEPSHRPLPAGPVLRTDPR